MSFVTMKPAWDDARHLTDIAPHASRAPSPIPLPPMQTNDPFVGTGGNDHRTGTSGADTFDMTQGGHDKVVGNGGDDQITFGSTFESSDTVRGGDGSDFLFLSGNAYASGLTVTSSMMSSIEILGLSSDNSFSFTFAGGVFATSAYFSIDGSTIGATHSLTVNSSANTKGILVTGGAGNDSFTCGGGADSFSANGGNDTFNGHGGNDTVFMGANLTAADHLNGGADSDALFLEGNYGTIDFGALNVTGFEDVQLSGAFDYTVKTVDATDTSHFIIDGRGITVGHSLTADGSAETNFGLGFIDSAGDDSLTGGAKDDSFTLTTGSDTVHTGGGENLIDVNGGLDSTDRLFGGSKRDIIALYQGETVTLTGTMLHDIDLMDLYGGYNYNITLADSLGSGSFFFAVSAFTDAAHHVTLDGSAETDGSLNLFGGDGSDTITGGAMGDSISGNAGADSLNGGGGADTYRYDLASDSLSAAYDTIVGFDADEDRFSGLTTITDVDAKIASGQLSNAAFDANLATACNGRLVANHAVIFTPTTGNHQGETFLIIDRNGTAGYQAGDMVIRLDHPLHISDLDGGNFS